MKPLSYTLSQHLYDGLFIKDFGHMLKWAVRLEAILWSEKERHEPGGRDRSFFTESLDNIPSVWAASENHSPSGVLPEGQPQEEKGVANG